MSTPLRFQEAAMFAPHLAEQLHEAARLVNTAPGPRGGQYRAELLDTAASLSRQFPERQLGSATTATLDQVHSLRTDLTDLWTQIASGAQTGTALERLNSLVESHGQVRLQLEQPEESAQAGPDDVTPAGARPAARWVLGEATGPAVDRFGRELVMAVAETAVAGELHRLKVCSGTDCANALVDATRNSSKQFCDEANCANRTHVRAYRERQASGEAPSPRDSAAPAPTPAASTATTAKTPAATPEPAPSSEATKDSQESPSSGISKKIRKLSARLQDPELSKKDRKRVVKKFKKLRKKLKDSADVELLEQLAPDVKK